MGDYFGGESLSQLPHGTSRPGSCAILPLGDSGKPVTPVWLVCADVCRRRPWASVGLCIFLPFSLVTVSDGGQGVGREGVLPDLCACGHAGSVLSSWLPLTGPARSFVPARTDFTRPTVRSPLRTAAPGALSRLLLAATDSLPAVARTSLCSLVRSTSVVRQRPHSGSSEEPVSYDRKNVQDGSC